MRAFLVHLLAPEKLPDDMVWVVDERLRDEADHLGGSVTSHVRLSDRHALFGFRADRRPPSLSVRGVDYIVVEDGTQYGFFIFEEHALCGVDHLRQLVARHRPDFSWPPEASFTKQDSEVFLRERLRELDGLSIHAVREYAAQVDPTPEATALVAKLGASACAIVSSGLSPVTFVLAAKLGIEHCVANSPEIENDRLTGHVEEPLVDGRMKVSWAKELMRRFEWSPEHTLMVASGPYGSEMHGDGASAVLGDGYGANAHRFEHSSVGVIGELFTDEAATCYWEQLGFSRTSNALDPVLLSKVKRGIRVIVEHTGVDPESIHVDARLMDDLGIDELDCVELFMAMEEELHAAIDDEVASGIETVGELLAAALNSEQPLSALIGHH